LEYISNRCAVAEELVNKGAGDLADLVIDSAASDLQNERKRMDDRNEKGLYLIHKFAKRVCQRNSAQFLSGQKNFVYQRDRQLCFADCPMKLKAKFRRVSKAKKISGKLCKLIRNFKEIPALFQKSLAGVSIQTECCKTAICFSAVDRISPCFYRQLPTAIQILLVDGTSHFIDFLPVPNHEILSQIPLTSPLPIRETCDLWVNRKLSNFSYLMKLNQFSGRTFDSFVQYPMLPNVMRPRNFELPIQPLCTEPPWDAGSVEVDRLFRESPLTPYTIRRSLRQLFPFAEWMESPIKSLDDLSGSEFPADFFFQSRIFEIPGFEFPKTAGSALSLIYKIRRVLESEEVTTVLHHWIDLIFGYSQRGEFAKQKGNIFHPWISAPLERIDKVRLEEQFGVMNLFGVMPTQLFESPHPPRSRIVENPSIELSLKLSSNELRFAAKVGKAEFWLLASNGQITSFDGHITQPVGRVELAGCSIHSVRTGLLLFDAKSIRVVARKAQFHEECCEADYVVSCGDNLCAVRNRTFLRLFTIEEFSAPIASLALTEDVVQHLVVNDVFHLLLIITRNDLLHYYSLKNLSQNFVVKLPLSSWRNVVVTETWGFVVVQFDAEICVFSLNAEFIGMYQHHTELCYVNSVASVNDFDYLAFVDVKRTLWIMDIVARRPVELVNQLDWQVLFIDYINGSDMLLVIAQNGKAIGITNPFVEVAKDS
jgi:hypothetical protein